jgi:hypothetical protein
MIGKTLEHLGRRSAVGRLAYCAELLGPKACAAGRDAWFQRPIEVFSRHDAVADALATAQLLLAVLAHAEGNPGASRSCCGT